MAHSGTLAVEAHCFSCGCFTVLRRKGSAQDAMTSSLCVPYVQGLVPTLTLRRKNTTASCCGRMYGEPDKHCGAVALLFYPADFDLVGMKGRLFFRFTDGVIEHGNLALHNADGFLVCSNPLLCGTLLQLLDALSIEVFQKLPVCFEQPGSGSFPSTDL